MYDANGEKSNPRPFVDSSRRSETLAHLASRAAKAAPATTASEIAALEHLKTSERLLEEPSGLEKNGGNKEHSEKLVKDDKDGKECKDSDKDSKEVSKDHKDSKESKDCKDSKEGKESKESKDSKDSKESKESKESPDDQAVVIGGEAPTGRVARAAGLVNAPPIEPDAPRRRFTKAQSLLARTPIV